MFAPVSTTTTNYNTAHSSSLLQKLWQLFDMGLESCFTAAILSGQCLLWVISGHSAAYSISLSARIIRPMGTSIPSDRAVVRLMMSLKVVGISMGMSPGLAPLIWSEDQL